MRKSLVLAGVAAVLAVAGCGGQSTSSGAKSSVTAAPGTAAPTTATTVVATTTTIATQVYGQEYLAIVGPTNAAVATFSKQIGMLPSSATGTQVQALCTTFAASLQDEVTKLARVTWPGQAESDVRTLVADEGAVEGDLNSCGESTSLGALITLINQDLGKSTSAASLIRGDLGLPAVPQ